MLSRGMKRLSGGRELLIEMETSAPVVRLRLLRKRQYRSASSITSTSLTFSTLSSFPLDTPDKHSCPRVQHISDTVRPHYSASQYCHSHLHKHHHTRVLLRSNQNIVLLLRLTLTGMKSVPVVSLGRFVDISPSRSDKLDMILV